MPNVRITLKAHPVKPPKTTDPTPTPVSTVPATPPVVPSTDTTTPTSITIAPTAVSGFVGDQVQLTATVDNTLGAVLTGTQPDAWHSDTPGVATVSNTGLISIVANGSAQVTATITTPSLTSNACTVTGSTAPPSGGSAGAGSEPVYDSNVDTLRYQDDFTRYSSALEMWNDRNLPDTRWTQADIASADGTVPANQDATGLLLLSPGRDGVTGKMLRFVYQGLYQEVHEAWLQHMVTLPARTEHVFQYWARVIMSSPLNVGNAGSELPFKWFMMWHPTAFGRCQHNTHDHLPYPTGPVGCLFQCYDQAATVGQGNQPVPPYATDLFNGGQWHRYTHTFLGNTTGATYDPVTGAMLTQSSRDGRSRMFIDGTKVIDVSSTAVGVTPTGGYKTWCEMDDVDALAGDGVNFLKIIGNLTADTPAFTVDWTEFKWWTIP